MKFKLWCLILSSLAWGQACQKADPRKNADTDSTAQSVEKLYATTCAGCHGNKLEQFKLMKTYAKDLSEITQIIANGNPNQGMPAFERLGDEQIQKLAEYIQKYDYTDSKAAASSDTKNYTVEVLVNDLEIPWGMAFLPNGDMLIAEKKGVLSRFSKSTGLHPIKGVPAVGRLLDVQLHPKYSENGWIYISYSRVTAPKS